LEVGVATLELDLLVGFASFSSSSDEFCSLLALLACCFFADLVAFFSTSSSSSEDWSSGAACSSTFFENLTFRLGVAVLSSSASSSRGLFITECLSGEGPWSICWLGVRSRCFDVVAVAFEGVARTFDEVADTATGTEGGVDIAETTLEPSFEVSAEVSADFRLSLGTGGRLDGEPGCDGRCAQLGLLAAGEGAPDRAFFGE
jgi:hypothetical protein